MDFSNEKDAPDVEDSDNTDDWFGTIAERLDAVSNDTIKHLFSSMGIVYKPTKNRTKSA